VPDVYDRAQELEQRWREMAIARARAKAALPPSGPRRCADCDEILTPALIADCGCKGGR